MATATHSSTSKSARKSSSASRSKTTAKKTAARQQDAIQLLKADHREVEKLFGQFTKAKGSERKMRLCHKIIMEFLVHAQIEEEIFYPACKDAMNDEDLVNEAIVEHQAAKDLIGEIRGMDPSDEMFDARMQVLQEQIEHHVKEEEDDLFPKAKKADLDMKALGERLAMRKKQLMRERQGDGMEIH
jgi:hemerythrin superfamily protein